MTENQKTEKQSEEKEFYFFKKVSLVDRYNFYEYLAVLLDGWVNVAESMLIAWEKIKNEYFRQKIRTDLFTFVSSGDSVSKSMKKLPQIFDAAEIAIIEAGETTGTLSATLFRLSDDLKKTYALTQKVKGALTYPSIIFIFLLAAILIVLTYVIPAIEPLFVDSGVELPFATKALIWTSDFIRNNFFLIILAVFAAFVWFFWYKTSEKGKANIDYILISFPLIWKVYKNYILSWIASNLGNLISSWVSIVKTITLVGRSTNNVVYETMLNSINERVMKWVKITDAMNEVDQDHDFFPWDFVQMLAVWEKTARIDDVSKKLYNQYVREVEYSLANLTKWIEPLAILIAWVFVLWFAFAIFGAILKVTQTVN